MNLFIFLHHEIGNNAIGGFFVLSCDARSELIVEAWSIQNILCCGFTLSEGYTESVIFLTKLLLQFLLLNKLKNFIE